MLTTKLKPISLALLLTGISPALVIPHAFASINEKVTVSPVKSISPREESIISSAGTKVLRHIAQARADIHNKKTKQASEQLSKAKTLLDIIQNALPTTQVKDRIWIAKKHLEYEDTKNVLPDLVPIFSSLDELVDVMPVKNARDHLNQAQKHLKAGDKQQAKKSLDETDAALEYTEIDLPMKATRDLVNLASENLKQNKLKEAGQALETAENSVIYLSYAVEQPLFAAKSMLWQTVLDLDAGNKDMARADLSAAVNSLEQASHSKDKPTREAAVLLLKDAKNLQADLTKGVATSSSVKHLWERTKAFADRGMDYLVSGWERFRSDKPFKSDMIEARLHVANARIDLFTGKEPAQAKKELAMAKQYLDEAAGKSNRVSSYKQYAEQIKNIEKEVQKLQPDNGKQTSTTYMTVEQQLSKVIRAL